VVAGEVKALASQTAKATDEIGAQIASVQDATNGAAAAVREIAESIRGVEHLSAAIAAAVEQQTATTNEIARNVSETSRAAQEVAERITSVSQEATATGDRASQVSAISGEVADSIAQLSEAVVRVVRTSTEDVNRRRSPRYRIDRAGRVRHGGRELALTVRNCSLGGALLGGPVDRVNVGDRVELLIEGFGPPLPGIVRAAGPDRLHLKFELSQAAKDAALPEFERLFTGREPMLAAA
jgi:ABC-type transporter Mla subunit MlaD